MVRGEAAVADCVPTVSVGEGNGVPAVVGGCQAATGDGVPTEAGGCESISNSTIGGVGGADTGGTALHPTPPTVAATPT